MGKILDSVAGRSRGLAVGLSLVMVLLYGSLFVESGRPLASHELGPRRNLEPANWVRENVPEWSAAGEGVPVGAFQSGYLAYFLPGHRIINLDGVVHSKAAESLAEGRMYEYIRKEGIRYVVDWPEHIEKLLFARSGRRLTTNDLMLIHRGFFDIYVIDRIPVR